MNQTQILIALAALGVVHTVLTILLLVRLRRPKTPTIAQLVNATGSKQVAALIKDQHELHDFAKTAVEAAEARYGAKTGQDKARFARQAVMDHAVAIGATCTGVQADALVHSHIANRTTQP